LIFVVDSSGDKKGPKEELHKLLAEEELKDAVLLVLANKQDLVGSMGEPHAIRKFL